VALLSGSFSRQALIKSLASALISLHSGFGKSNGVYNIFTSYKIFRYDEIVTRGDCIGDSMATL
jgi:hypothetical protein